MRQSDRPPFEPEADKFGGANRFAAVDDGWLIGFNHGEFGALLVQSRRKAHYLISEVDLATNKLRMLVPSKEFLNKLPDDDERRLRKLYTHGMSHGGLPPDFCEQMEERAKAIVRKPH